MRILILGGYGAFGGRLASLLKDEPRLTLVIAGRSLAKAEAFCAALGGAARLEARALDRDGDLHGALAALRLDVVVDASGPFQNYGARAYRVVESCLALGIDYLDLADGAAFVDGVSAYDARAGAAGVFVLSGVSSFPVLTAAVVRSVSEGFDRVTAITGGVAPSPYAGVGRNVIEAIASYAGRPLPLRCDGRDGVGHGLVETRRRTIAVPGGLPLRSRLFSLVEVPDLRLLPRHWPEVRDVWMGAGPVPELLHRGLILLAGAVKRGWAPSLAPLAGLFAWAVNTVRWGEHRGGMFVDVEGEVAGRVLKRSWHMLAEGDDGPLIPSMACAAIIARALDGAPPHVGARAATAALELSDYERLFAGRRIVTGRWEAGASEATLYQDLLGEAFQRLPASVQALHARTGVHRYAGRAHVDRGTNVLAQLVAAVFGFPAASADVPVEVELNGDGGRETWTRSFGGRPFSSTQEAGKGANEHLVVERFGPFAFGMALVVDGGRLKLVVRRWTLFGVPLPTRLGPDGEACETETDGRFRFHVDIRAPMLGRIVRYRGWLEPLDVH